jgi:HEAT repeat protein
VTAIRTHVGEPRRGGAGRATDLGSVSAREAAGYLLSLAARLDGKPAADAIFPAVLADADGISPPLLRIARDPGRPREARKKAITWVGTLGEEGAVRSLDAIAADAEFDANLREQALAALAFVPDGGGVESLVRFARGRGEMRLRRKAAFWLGNADDPRARRVLRELASDDGEPSELRGEAIFALGHLDATPEDGAFLRALYPRLASDELRDKLIQSVAQTGKEDDQSVRWLLSRVADEDESPEARKKALFWAGQQDETPIDELVRLYPRLRAAELKEHYTFVLSQRDERAATDELIRIARADPDPQVRKKALFWLGQRDDPRAAAFIRDAILKP